MSPNIKKITVWIAIFVVGLAVLLLRVYSLLAEEEYVRLTGNMRYLQKALLVYSDDHGGSDARLVLPESLGDLVKERYMTTDDLRGPIDAGFIEYRGRVPGVTMETPLIRGRMESGVTYWCAAAGPISKGNGW